MAKDVHISAVEAHHKAASMEGTNKAAHWGAAKAHLKAAEHHELEEHRHTQKAEEHNVQAPGGLVSDASRSRAQAVHSIKSARDSHFYAKSTVRLLTNAKSHDVAKSILNHHVEFRGGNDKHRERARGHEEKARKDRSEALGLSSEHGDKPSIEKTKQKLEESHAEAKTALTGLPRM